MSNKNNNLNAPRAQWASSIGFILSAAGSAVGLGNIWKFPGKAYAGGGAAFLIIYILIVVFIGAAAMLGEFSLGRHTQKNPVGAFASISKRWKWVGALSVITAFIIMCYYVQVGGWVINYMVDYATNSASIFADSQGHFLGMLGAESFPFKAAFLYPFIFLGLTVFVIIKGVESGIEKFNKIAMPVLFIILVVLTIRSVTLPGAEEGLSYMLKPDFSKVTFDTVLTALGQAFYSLSLGMAIMITYGSYLGKGENIGKNVGIICVFDSAVAFLAGFMIIPAVFAAGVEPGMGGGFAFTSLTGVFQSMPAGALFGFLFYTLLFVAALTSAISILEGIIACITEEFGWNRKKAAIGLAIAMLAIGSLYTLSQVHLPLKGIWFDAVNGLQYPGLGDFMEYLTDRLTMPIAALFTCIFIGWVWKPKNVIAEVRQNGIKFPSAKIWSFLIRFISPTAIALILIFGLVFGMSLS